MAAAGSHLLRLGPALWKFALRCPPDKSPSRDGRWDQAGIFGMRRLRLEMDLEAEEIW